MCKSINVSSDESRCYLYKLHGTFIGHDLLKAGIDLIN